ncbi:MAG TPA: HAMP domain-containing sensor histidine kinase [Castellaniella sp.]|nr:HAMP domain-containing sensor histidine kinase [Castellaniella sp.]
MDGLKRRLNASLQFRLSFTLSVIILVVAGAAGAISFFSALDEAHELQDDVLYQVAELMDQRHLVLAPGAASTQLADGDDDSYVVIQPLRRSSQPPGAGPDPLALDPGLPEGMHTVDSRGTTYRVLIRHRPSGEGIAIAQDAGFRDRIALESALRTLLPFLILVPVLLLIVPPLVRKMFRPITGLSGAIDQRSFEDLRPVPEADLPGEIRPFASAINRLLVRLTRSREMQRRFVADAAHELRSPMTALSLQAERLDASGMPAQARERLATLRQGIRRSRELLDQLLSLARAQSPAEPARETVSILKLYRQVLEDLVAQAHAKQIDLGVSESRDVNVRASELDLSTLVRNLVDNAIRYTPDGGRIDLSVRLTDTAVELCVSDTGPGIPAAERQRVFDPFYRVLGTGQLGSGLGLAIVRTIVNRLGARIDLDDADPAGPSGLKVTVSLPRDRCA